MITVPRELASVIDYYLILFKAYTGWGLFCHSFSEKKNPKHQTKPKSTHRKQNLLQETPKV